MQHWNTLDDRSAINLAHPWGSQEQSCYTGVRSWTKPIKPRRVLPREKVLVSILHRCCRKDDGQDSIVSSI
jgi:hypothetical protein